jgi:hypothetical protein
VDLGGRLGDVGHVDLPGHHLVPKGSRELGDLLETPAILVRHQYT